jgi:hypothetical protein
MNSIRILFLLVAVGWAHTQVVGQTASAEEYFNRAAKQYVKEDKTSALRTIDKGLQEFPGDARLLKLAEELLKEEQQQQQMSQQQQEQQEQEQQQGEKGQDQEPRQGEENGDEKQQGGQEQQRNGPADKPKPKPGRISPQEAERMLDAMDRQEKEVQDKVRNRQRPAPRTPVEKDW